MYLILKPGLDPDLQNRFVEELKAARLEVVPLPGLNRRAFALVGSPEITERFATHPYVEECIRDAAPYKRVARALHPHDTLVPLGDVSIGGDSFIVIAGPCAVETPEQMQSVAAAVRAAGAHGLRGGAFKPRTSPYSFQGHGRSGLQLLREAASPHRLPIVTEIMDAEDLPAMMESVQVLQVGTRNMQNFSLLKRAGRLRKPVLIKRGLSATLEEFLMAAEYVMSEGNYQVSLCERGVRTFSDHARNTLDLSVIPAIRRVSHLPILVDPSHGTGRRDSVLPMARAAVAAGADGILVEVHHQPEKALSDGPQSIYPDQFARMMDDLAQIAPVVGRRLARGIRVETPVAEHA